MPRDQNSSSVLAGIHPVREALLANRTLDRVLIARGAGGARIQEIIDLCRDRRIPVRFDSRAAIDRAAKQANHQGIVAYGAVRQYAGFNDLPSKPRLVVVLDGIEDPHNLGAIIRTAHAAGADAVVCPERRAAGLTETVAKAAAGAIEHLLVIRVPNVNRSLDELKSRGFWIYGVDERGPDVYSTVDYAEPTALVLGGEGHGLHEQVRKHCDFVIRIPMAGAISSLNVSVAAGVVLFDWTRKKALAEPRPSEPQPAEPRQHILIEG